MKILSRMWQVQKKNLYGGGKEGERGGQGKW